jgi:hypothetical protein
MSKQASRALFPLDYVSCLGSSNISTLGTHETIHTPWRHNLPRLRRIIERLAQEVRKAVALPQVQTQIATQGVETASSTPAEFRSFVGSEIAKWGKVVNAVA